MYIINGISMLKSQWCSDVANPSIMECVSSVIKNCATSAHAATFDCTRQWINLILFLSNLSLSYLILSHLPAGRGWVLWCQPGPSRRSPPTGGWLEHNHCQQGLPGQTEVSLWWRHVITGPLWGEFTDQRWIPYHKPLYYWSFRSGFPRKGPVMQSFDILFVGSPRSCWINSRLASDWNRPSVHVHYAIYLRWCLPDAFHKVSI